MKGTGNAHFIDEIPCHYVKVGVWWTIAQAKFCGKQFWHIWGRYCSWFLSLTDGTPYEFYYSMLQHCT